MSAQTDADEQPTNSLGGAMALATRSAPPERALRTLVHHPRRTGGRLGLQMMFEGGGMANATVAESL